MFDRIGLIRYPKDAMTFEAIFEAALEGGAQNVEESEKSYEVECTFEDFAAVRDHLMTAFGDPETAELIWKANNTTAVDEEKAITLMKFIDVLEDNDDVQSVFANFDIPDAVMEKLM